MAQEPQARQQAERMIEEPFATGTTLFHRCDARIKLISALALSLVLALNNSLTAAVAGCFVSIALLILSKPAPLLLGRRIALVNIFTLFLWLILPFSYEGDSFSGVQVATLITLKTNAILFCFQALVATSRTVNLGYALERLGLPDKLVFLLLFSYRQLFIIHQEYTRLQRAAKLRGFLPGNNLHTYRTYSHLFAMTLVKSWNRAGRVYQAMILRGFNGKLIPLKQQELCGADYLFLSVLIFTALLLATTSIFPNIL